MSWKYYTWQFLEFWNAIIKKNHERNLISSNLAGLFEEKMRNESNKLYYGLFKVLPSIKIFHSLNTINLMKYISEEYSSQILFVHKKEEFNPEKNRFEVTNIIYILKKQISIELINYTLAKYNDYDNAYRVFINYNQKNEKEAEKIISDLLQFKEPLIQLNSIYLIISTNIGLDKRKLELKKTNLKLKTHYNDDLRRIHLGILKKLRAQNESGLFLFHGEPGTGKSTYIRHLIQSVKKTVIFISPNLAGKIDSPSFTEFLIDNPNSIFVIEDAENLIISRDAENNSAISMILNLTDGLLGEGLGIQFICTFNTDLSRIDKALLRKGRLKALYEFTVLDVEKSNQLFESLQFNFQTTMPMTLAEIYNLKEDTFDFNGEKKLIGFAA